MKKIILTLLVLLSATQNLTLQAQTTTIDSLFTVLKTAKEDTTKVNTLNALATKFNNSDPDTAIYFANQALALGTNLNYEKGTADAHFLIGTIITRLGKYEEALRNLNDAIKLYDQLLTSEKTADKSKIAKQKAWSYNNIGIIYYEQGNYPEALRNYFAALKIREETGDKKGIAASYNNIGIIYSHQGNYPEALKNHFASLRIMEETGNKKGIALSYNNIGTVYWQQGNYPEALKNHLAALEIRKEIGDKKGIADSYNDIGLDYKRQGNYPEALKNYFASLKIREETGDKAGIARAYNNIGTAYTKQKKYDEASGYLNKGLSLAKEMGSLNDVKEDYSGLAELDSAQGNFKQALEYYKLFIATRDSMVNKENTKKITQQQMQYDFDKKQVADSIKTAAEKKIISAQLKQEQTRSYALYGGLALMILVAGLFFRQRNKIGKEKQRSDNLLLNILPGEVAEELKTTGRAKAKAFTMVTVMLTDFKDFTTVSEKVSAELLVDEIHTCFSAFDHILQKHKIEKIKTIGDAYLCASGLPVSNYTHATDMVHAAFEIRSYMLQRKKEKEAKGEIPFELRIGIHTGPVVAGIVGVKKYAYDIWGDTVNLAARMEQNSEAGKVNISGSTYELVKDKFICTHRGKIQAKNKGEIDMYFVELPI